MMKIIQQSVFRCIKSRIVVKQAGNALISSASRIRMRPSNWAELVPFRCVFKHRKKTPAIIKYALIKCRK